VSLRTLGSERETDLYVQRHLILFSHSHQSLHPFRIKILRQDIELLYGDCRA
jgi:hypothetical protein